MCVGCCVVFVVCGVLFVLSFDGACVICCRSFVVPPLLYVGCSSFVDVSSLIEVCCLCVLRRLLCVDVCASSLYVVCSLVRCMFRFRRLLVMVCRLLVCVIVCCMLSALW